jgi:hypothetical protein
VAVVDVVRALGSWSLNLADTVPQAIRDLLDEERLGHIVIDAGRDNPAILGDALLSSARYVGVLQGTDIAKGSLVLSGVGMAFWLDTDAIESATTFTAATFSSVITSLLPSTGSVTAGAITTPSGAGTYRGTHQYQTRRKAIDYVVDLYTCDWRVNGDATLDAGPTSALFADTPTAAIIARTEGADMSLRALPGSAKLARDVQDYTTRVVTVAEGNGRTVAVGTADVSPASIPYKDINGVTVKLTKLVSESNTSLTNANARAQLQLAKFNTARDTITLSSATHDIRGDLEPGDNVWVYDPDANLVDEANEVMFRGERIYPVKLRIFQLNWPVQRGMGVYFRASSDASWTDLTDYVTWETGATTITVGTYDRSLTQLGTEPVGSRVVADASVPGVPTLGSLTTAVYQSTGGQSRARINVPWTQPLNTDSSVIVDGDHYEIQYRSPSGGSGTWTTQNAAFDQTTATIVELTPATDYGIRIRAVDGANPPNVGAWSSEVVAVTAGDSIAPPTPAAPTVAGNPLAIQVLHTLGKATGGTYNLDTDMAYFEVHASAAGSGFTVDNTPVTGTQVGKLPATYSMIAANVPAIGTFTTPSTSLLYVKVVAVDESGNRSAASAAATATASLVDDAHISTLTVSKVTAGTIASNWVIGAQIATGTTGARAGMDPTGFFAYNSSSVRTFTVDATTGDVTVVGTVTTGASGPRAVITPGGVSAGIQTPGVVLWASSATSPAIAYASPDGTGTGPSSFSIVSSLNTSSNGTFFEAQNNLIKLAFVHQTTPTLTYPNGVFDTYGGYVLATQTTVDLGLEPSGTPAGGRVFLNSTNAIVETQGSSGAVAGGFLNTSSTNAVVGYAPSGTNVSTATVGTDIVLAASGDVRSTVAMGTTTGGFSLKLQNGGSSGVRSYYDSGTGTMRFVDNQSGGTWMKLGDGGGAYKNFVIDHPTDPDRWLVHACTEAPEAQVEYRGVAVLNGGVAEVELPGYFEVATLAEDRTVHVSMLLPDDPLGVHLPGPDPVPPEPPWEWPPAPDPVVVPERSQVHAVAASVPVAGRFRIASTAADGTRVAWLVKAVRADGPRLDPEPLRSAVQVHGDGPYRHLTPLLEP